MGDSNDDFATRMRRKRREARNRRSRSQIDASVRAVVEAEIDADLREMFKATTYDEVKYRADLAREKSRQAIREQQRFARKTRR